MEETCFGQAVHSRVHAERVALADLVSPCPSMAMMCPGLSRFPSFTQALEHGLEHGFTFEIQTHPQITTVETAENLDKLLAHKFFVAHM